MSYPLEKLLSHIEILSGYAFKSKDFRDAGVPVIKIKNVTPPSVTLEDLSFVSKEIAQAQSKFQLKYGDVLIALTGSHINQMASVVGRVARVKYHVPSLINQRVGKIIAIDPDDIDIDFVYYFLSQNEIKIKLASKAGGAANQANISPSDVKNLEIPFPDIVLQRRIASVLLAYDNLIENNQKQIELLEEATQRLYKEWFVDLRFPGHENIPIVDGVPVGWEKVGLVTIAPIVTGKKDANFGTPDGKYLFFTCAQEPIKAPSYSFDCDAVILAGNGDFNVTLYRGQFEAYQRTYVFSPHESKHLYLLYHAVRESMRQLFQGASGSTIKFLTKHMLEDIAVFIPDKNTLNAFNRTCAAIQQKVECLRAEITYSRESHDRLLPKLMSGEIEV